MDVGPYVVLVAFAIGIPVLAYLRQWWQTAFCSILAVSIASRYFFDAGVLSELLIWMGLGALAAAGYRSWRQRPKSQSHP